MNFQLKSKVPDTSERTNYVYEDRRYTSSAGAFGYNNDVTPSRSVMLR